MKARASTRGVAKLTRHTTKPDLGPGYEWTWKGGRALPRKPWHGLTPEEAYRKGVEAGKADEREQQELRDRRKHPLTCHS